jgi:hypothetical protein
MGIQHTFIESELLRYGSRGALRVALLRSDISTGEVFTGVPPGVLAKVKATDDIDCFLGSVAYWGVPRDDIVAGYTAEVRFLQSVLNSDSSLTMFSLNSYSQSSRGFERRVGSDEYLTLLPLKEPVNGSTFEGWSTARVSGDWAETDVETVLAYASLPFPPGLTVLCADPAFARDQSEEPPRIRLQGDEWIEECLRTLRLLVVQAFDCEGSLLWIPSSKGREARAMALSSGLNLIP